MVDEDGEPSGQGFPGRRFGASGTAGSGAHRGLNRLAARVRHPNVVQVYEVGEQDGCPYLAMEWIEGGTLADRLDDRPWPPAAAAELVEVIASAVQAAHDEGVVHRDLKPANILLAGAREDSEVPEGPTFHETAPLPE